MDGNYETPIGRFPNGLILLSPMDVRPFNPRPWSERRTKLGLVGGIGHTNRHALISQLSAKGLLTFHNTDTERSYADMAETMCNTKVTLNSPFNGTGDRLHVKGRVIEAGFAGCCLMEGVGSPTSAWFQPGVDYLEYRDIEHAAWLINETPDDQLREMAARFHERIMIEHHPKTFWNKALTRAGVVS
jgi:hypothetical protein